MIYAIGSTEEPYVRVGQLRDALNGLNDDLLIVLAKDGEGNSFSPLSEAEGSTYDAENNVVWQCARRNAVRRALAGELMSRRERRSMVLVTVVLAVSAGVLGWAQSARATTIADPSATSARHADNAAGLRPGVAEGKAPPCQVTGHLEVSGPTSPNPYLVAKVSGPRARILGAQASGHVTAVFTVAETCREVSLLSWLAPDAHAGNPQVLYDRRSQSDVAPGDYRWTITTPPPGCYFQYDLRVPGHNVDALLGGTRKCETPIPTTTPSSTTSPSSTTTTSPPIASTVTTPTVGGPASSAPPPASVPATLPHSGNGEVGAMTVAALGLIGAGCWVELRGRRRRARG